MARIAGVNIPDDKRIEIALTYIHGIGRPRSKQILAALSMNPDTRTKTLSENDINKLKDYIETRHAEEGGFDWVSEIRDEHGKHYGCSWSLEIEQI